MKYSRILIAGLAALVIAVALAACGGSDSDTSSSSEGVEIADWGGQINADGEPKSGGSLRIDMSLPPAAASPLEFLVRPDNATMQVVMQVFNQLVEYLPGSIEPQPGLAESWDISQDGLTYTFNLREAEFSNGMPVTSADVKYVLDFARGPESRFGESLFGAIKSVSDPDPRTVVIKLDKPVPALLDYLATPGVGIVPAQLVEKEGVEAFNQNPIGSGPFEIKSWRPEEFVDLVRNENYWREGKPYLDAVDLVVTENDNTRVLNVESGASDVADFPPFNRFSSIDGSGQAKVLVSPGADMGVFFVNNAKAPLDETAVRQALNYATPVDSIIETVFAGQAPRMNTTMPKLKYWTDKAKAYPFDTEKAKEVLAESSVPDGFSVEIKFVGSDESSAEIAQIVQQTWGEIGVDVKISPMDIAALGEDFPVGKWDLILFPPGSFTSDVPVDDEFATLLFNDPVTKNFFTNYSNKETERLASEAVVEMDEEKRAQLFEELQVKSMEDPINIPLVYTPNRAAVANDVKAFNYLLIGFWRLEDVWKD